MKIPGPDHPITVTPHDGRIIVRFNGRVIADTRHALRLQEASYPPVFYIPRSAADMSLFIRTGHRTHCPYKGDAGYFTLRADGHEAVNAAWTYEEPYPAVAGIKEHLAFYPNRVDAIEEVAG